MKHTTPLKVLGVFVFGAVWVILFIYLFGWRRDWKLPGMAALKHEFSSFSKKSTASSSPAATAATTTAAKNFFSGKPYPNIDMDANGNTYCPYGWVVNWSNSSNYEKYQCYNLESGESAQFDSNWNTSQKQNWAAQKGVSWARPAPWPPSYISAFRNVDPKHKTTYCPEGWVVSSYESGQSYVCQNYYDTTSSCGGLMSTAKFTNWDFDLSKKAWAQKCNAKWPNPSNFAPTDPPEWDS